MTLAFATLEGHRVTRAEVHVPGIGVWFADLELEEAPLIEGRVLLALGDLALVGTVEDSGSIALTRRLRIVAGNAGWSKLVPAKSYHSDAGVRASLVAQDVARETQETLATFDVANDGLGIDYSRTAGPAAQTLSDVIGGTPWWVAFDGLTHVGTRVPTTAVSGTYEITEVVPDRKLVTLAADDLRAVGIGSTLSDRLDEPLTIHEYVIELDEDAVRVRAWCGSSTTTEGRIARAMRLIVKRSTDDRIVGGPWKYRVVRMVSGRVELQAVVRDAGLPDLGPVSIWPGVAGASAELAPGAELLVDFVDGDRRQPLVRGFAPKNGAGHVPLSLVLDASQPSASLKLGASATKKLAYADDVAAEFAAIATTLGTGTAGGDAVVFGTPYTPPSSSAISTQKAVAE